MISETIAEVYAEIMAGKSCNHFFPDVMYLATEEGVLAISKNGCALLDVEGAAIREVSREWAEEQIQKSRK